MGKQNPPPAVAGPWFCVLDADWRLLYLGTDELAAAAEAAATPGAVTHRADRMGDALSGAAHDVGAAKRRKDAA